MDDPRDYDRQTGYQRESRCSARTIGSDHQCLRAEAAEGYSLSLQIKSIPSKLARYSSCLLHVHLVDSLGEIPSNTYQYFRYQQTRHRESAASHLPTSLFWALEWPSCLQQRSSCCAKWIMVPITKLLSCFFYPRWLLPASNLENIKHVLRILLFWGLCIPIPRWDLEFISRLNGNSSGLLWVFWMTLASVGAWAKPERLCWFRWYCEWQDWIGQLYYDDQQVESNSRSVSNNRQSQWNCVI